MPPGRPGSSRTRLSALARPERGGRCSRPLGTLPTPWPRTPRPPTVERDARLPRPGGVLTRTFQGKEIKVQVLDAGFGYEGKTWRSLSAIAKAVTGTSWNGFLFFGLQTRAKQPTDAAPAAKDGAK